MMTFEWPSKDHKDKTKQKKTTHTKRESVRKRAKRKKDI